MCYWRYRHLKVYENRLKRLVIIIFCHVVVDEGFSAFPDQNGPFQVEDTLPIVVQGFFIHFNAGNCGEGTAFQGGISHMVRGVPEEHDRPAGVTWQKAVFGVGSVHDIARCMGISLMDHLEVKRV